MTSPDSDDHQRGYDPQQLATNLARLVEESGKAASAWLRPREQSGAAFELPPDFSEALRALGRVGAAWLNQPDRLLDAQRRLFDGFAALWSNTMRRYSGETVAPVAEPERRDKRFADSEWSSSPVFDFIKQAYLISSRWAESMVGDAADVDRETRSRAEFYLRQIVAALAPSNFVPTNPELLRRTLDTNGDNLVRGMRMLAEDIAAGNGTLKVRQTDSASFEVGRNLAVTPGKVIHQNEVCQILQYAPTTPEVLKRPLLIVPPWINKFYILDLSPEKSFIRWAVSQGHTVFVVSWVNPDGRQAGKSFEDYMREGILAALDVVEAVSGWDEINAIGYCVGGTLLAATLAFMAETGDDRIASATFFTAQTDFTQAGDLRLFADEVQVQALERRMEERGFLEGEHMASAFNLLRPNDLIWPYVVGNYLMGDPPQAFDLLYWNSDSTRMPAANHAFYLRACYLENRLARGIMELGGVRLDLGKVTIPVYELATREDHIAPARSVYKGARLFGGPVEMVLAGSGHIAGVVNPPAKVKYQHWTDGDASAPDLDAWLASATEHPGSWWPHWHAWISGLDGETVPARKIGPRRKRYPPIEDAPGSYVKVKS